MSRLDFDMEPALGEPSVTVVSCARNGLAFIPQLLRQLRSITYRSIEFVIVDDGSSDGSFELLSSETSGDPRFRLVRLQESLGVARARNIGVREASGDYVWFVDVDDTWNSNSLSLLVSGTRQRDGSAVDMVLARAEQYRVDQDRVTRTLPSGRGPFPLSGRDGLRQILIGDIRGHLWNKLIKRAILVDHPFPAARVRSDLSGITSIVANCQKIVGINHVVYSYRVRSGSLVTDRSMRPADLWLCRSSAIHAAQQLEPPLEDFHRLITDFTIREVLFPFASECIKRRGDDDLAEWERALEDALDLVGRRDRRRLWREGDYTTWIRLTVLRRARPVYRLSHRLKGLFE